MENRSFVFWYSSLERHSCGYCKNESGNISHGMLAKSLTVEDYQNLIDRGWRRSGNYCYKPVMDQICCPMYTIKCDALNFQLSKSQKKVIKKFNKFLKDGILDKTEQSQELAEAMPDFMPSSLRQPPAVVIDSHTSDIINNATSSQTKPSDENQTLPGKSQVNVAVKSGTGADPTKPPCKKAKTLRLERKQEKLLKRGMSLEKIQSVKNQQKSLEEFLNDVPPDCKHKFKLQLVHANQRNEEWDKVKKIEFALYRKYQMVVHNDPPEKCTLDGFLRFLVNSPLQITLEQLCLGHKYFKLVAKLFEKYQIAIHNESTAECDEEHFFSFLIETPLQHNSELGLGSFHQLYWLDDKLIAVGVLDILPKCVSAVYFFYDPDYRSLTLGTYGSLREVEFVRNLHVTIPSLQWYYMGFYIHSCQKMRYKGKLSPSYLLCPETYHWVQIDRCLSKFENSNYAKLEDDEKAIDEGQCTRRDVEDMVILANRKLLRFKLYRRKYGDCMYPTIANLVGRKCAQTLIFISDH